jgi:hypothetical protein
MEDNFLTILTIILFCFSITVMSFFIFIDRNPYYFTGYKYIVYCEHPEVTHVTNNFYAYGDGTITFYDPSEKPTVYIKENLYPDYGTLYYKIKYTRIEKNRTFKLLTISEILYISQQNSNFFEKVNHPTNIDMEDENGK